MSFFLIKKRLLVNVDDLFCSYLSGFFAHGYRSEGCAYRFNPITLYIFHFCSLIKSTRKAIVTEKTIAGVVLSQKSCQKLVVSLASALSI